MMCWREQRLRSHQLPQGAAWLVRDLGHEELDLLGSRPICETLRQDQGSFEAALHRLRTGAER